MQRQRRFSNISHRLLFSGTQLAIATLVVTAIPCAPAAALRIRSIEPPDDYQVCATRLLRAGISPNDLANACSGALHPDELSRCVLRIKLRTPINPQDALSACSQVRRPEDVSNCVLEINSHTKNPPIADVLDYCRRSLLPISFSDCVVGLNRAIDISTARALDSCFDTTAELPRSPYRTFLPLVLPPVPTTNPPAILPPLSSPNQTLPLNTPATPVSPAPLSPPASR